MATEEKTVVETQETPVVKPTGRKRGPKPKTTAAKKPTSRRGMKKVEKMDKAPVAKTPVKAASKYTFTRTVFEYQKIQYTEEIAQKKVLEYMEKHPYIKAEKIETFINFDEHKIFFTVDGYSNPDFTLDL
ncbi:hypothetical protein [Oribacterium sp. NK2B42]|uniref:hypothetical protein n=1 Tax=Oribacterium sp. NK2B42 TaxID=689781 RepID=UPI00041F0098|nr:hypothetical protein [Oribacterium sp. NK2B42]